MRIASDLGQKVPEPCDAHLGNGWRLPRIIKLDRSVVAAADDVPYSKGLDYVRPAQWLATAGCGYKPCLACILMIHIMIPLLRLHGHLPAPRHGH